MEIIPFDKTYLDEIEILERECFSIPWSKQMFEQELENQFSVYFVAIENECIIGYCGMWRILDEGHITNIAVSPKFRKLGIGQSLLDKLILFSKGNKISELLLEVRKSNAPAIKLYLKNGFVSVGIRKGYYTDDNEDAVLMNLNLGKE